MGRVSQAQAQENRRRVIESASRMYRERGSRGVSVRELMAEAGLTHGGFYKQFGSQQQLLTEAIALAFDELSAQLAGFDAEHPEDRAAAQEALLQYYLSIGHRDEPAHGCPTAGFGPDLAREEHADAPRAEFADGVRSFADWLEEPGDDGRDAADAALTRVCTMVGALVLARATRGQDLSEHILETVRSSLSADVPSD